MVLPMTLQFLPPAVSEPIQLTPGSVMLGLRKALVYMLIASALGVGTGIMSLLSFAATLSGLLGASVVAYQWSSSSHRLLLSRAIWARSIKGAAVAGAGCIALGLAYLKLQGQVDAPLGLAPARFLFSAGLQLPVTAWALLVVVASHGTRDRSGFVNA
ncbi:MAG: hypothetical protein A2580_00980 [Hydrogenophilales bacterium RIFOXYD1_FULL_62_11]|nr:MAG: hypothetical protein A2580_00980 [Hydrogenophilales bacterium RIFOXYD1_FULL_62_11]